MPYPRPARRREHAAPSQPSVRPPRHGGRLPVSAIALALLATLAANVALAANVEPGVQGPLAAGISPIATLARLGAALALVLLAFWGCARLMRRLQANHPGGEGLRVVGGLSLGQRERLVVVQAGAVQLLLGISPGRIERLHVLEEPLGDLSSSRPRADIGVADEGGTGTSARGRTSLAGADDVNGGVGGAADFRAKLLAAMQRRVSS